MDAARQANERAQAGDQRNIVELAHLHKSQLEAGLGNQAALHAARRAHEEHLGRVARHQFTGHGQRRDDVASGAAAGDQYAQVRQTGSFRAPEPKSSGFSVS